jgi:hypothetical protein
MADESVHQPVIDLSLDDGGIFPSALVSPRHALQPN